ncbi:MAG TPA: hypothetical protein VMJ32_01810, partial [Pirellulales bacterium]|nr:hypothetical protein [Pirellulales bacterium]
MGERRRTLVPQFTLRWILTLTAAMAVVSLVLARALQAEAWAGGVIIGLVALAVMFVVYAAMFWGVWLFGHLITALQSRRKSRLKQREDDIAASTSPTGDQPHPTKTVAHTIKTVLWFVALTLSVLATRTAWPASGTSIQTPQLQPGEVNKTGLTLTLDIAWVDASGYRPVRVSVKSIARPVIADRVLSVTFRPKQGYSLNESMAVTQTVEIPAGHSSADITLAVPELCGWGMFALDVYEDGEYVKQLSIPDNSATTSWGGTTKGDGASPVVLVLSGLDKISGSFLVNPAMELMGVAPDNPAAVIDSQIANATFFGTPLPGGNPTTPATASSAISSLADLPTRWIDYSCFDVMLISLDKLTAFDAQKPAPSQWGAIRDWLHNGGTLIVYDAGRRWQNIGQLEELTWMSDASHLPAADEDDPTKSGWKLPLKSLRDQPLLTDIGPVNAANSNAQAGNHSDQDSSAQTPLDAAPFITRPCGLGLVVAIPTDESIGKSSFPWTWLFNTVGPQRWQWSQRWGVSLYQNNNEFWNFLIPGVGLVPVLQFQVLITLFVVLLGPVNYYLLRRWGKLNLTVLTVPAGAFLITAALLLYALVEDGLSVRARARSFTHIDQRSGEATCWTRLSYYAGLAPSGGLKFAEDTAVIPFALQALANEEQPSRTLDWEHADRTDSVSPLEQHFTNGWLYSRTPTQFITARIRKCAARLEIHASAGSQPPKVVNRLNTPIKRLLLVDENGACSTAADVAADATAALQAAESQSKAYLQQLQPLWDANQNEVSLVVPSGGADLFGFGRGQNNQNRYALAVPATIANNTSPISEGTGMLEQSLTELRAQLLIDSLPARTYVAIVESSPEVQWGTPTVRPEES